MLREMLRKVRIRAWSLARPARRDDAVRWAQAHAEPLEEFASSLDLELWNEAQEYAHQLNSYAETRLAAVKDRLGGGGDYRLLFFLVRYLTPRRVVETGVAAGFSSAAILEAIARNGSGRLSSSDLPYFRIDDPERYVGWVVRDEIKVNWDLHLDGDRAALPRFAEAEQRVDLLHYDSDKSYEGRTYALRTLASRLGPESVIVFDDIQDNLHFRDWTSDLGRPFHVFEFDGKWVGLVGL